MFVVALSFPCTTAYAEHPQVTKPPIVVGDTIQDGIPMVAPPSHAIPPEIVSQSAVVMDLKTGTVVYAKNPQVQHYPASLTKIMTALLALQRGRLSDTLTAHSDATNVPPDKLYLVPGEHESLQKLLYGLLLISANDAAIVIADHYGGSVPGFAKLMNEEAKELGAVHTHFVNPNGLPNSAHVTTAYDLALISRAAMQVPEFRRIVRTESYAWHGQAWSSELTNINHMLYDYPGDIGVKTGWTSAANETLVAAATHGNQTFLAVLLDAPTGPEINHDATVLLNYAFDHYRTVDITRSGSSASYAITSTGVRIPLQATRSIMATVRIQDAPDFTVRVTHPRISHSTPAGKRLGALRVLANGAPVAIDPISTTMPFTQPLPAHRTDILWLIGLVVVLFSMLRYNRRSSRRQRGVQRYRA